jgi:hypothetical protein
MRRLWISIPFALSALVVLALPGPALGDDDDHSSPHALAFQSVMIGLAQVPEVASTGRGVASYLVTSDSATLYYSVGVTEVSSTVGAAHIHLGSPGQNGQVVANLCGAGSTPGCMTEGVIATGTVTAGDLVGPLAGHPLGDLIVAMTAGGTYTNVHTANFPDGEIRGQVVLVAAAGDENNGNGNGDNSQGDNGQGNDNHDDHDEGDD